MPQHTEHAFETAIEVYLLADGGYQKGNSAAFDTARALFTTDVLAFIKESQPQQWQRLVELQKGQAESTLLDDLCRALNSANEGCLSVLRHGFKCYGQTFRMAYFAPASGMNPDTAARYRSNRLSVTRQLRYAPQYHNTLDITLALNGIPVVTLELKNPMTAQTWRDAIKQYKNDRAATDLIFQFRKRALVHFAVDPDEVYMTTRLDGANTRFLPFNQGCHNGAGNPPNPDGYKTAYLWQQVLARDSLLDILARFMHLQTEAKKPGSRGPAPQTMIFPRYHQLDCVRRLVDHARTHGTGKSYLVQHSAGSGKSNSIAWLAHRLATLHTDDNAKVFDSVVVVTDRIVLDQQLQDTIYQFEHKQGVVQKIDTDSAQLATALESGALIIVTTLQKFPNARAKMQRLAKKTYAVIIDEAHSSQSGENAADMRGTLAAPQVHEAAAQYGQHHDLDAVEEEIHKIMLARGQQPNLSLFAFTATPKYKTLEVFGRTDADDEPQPFHLYSMRQAIDEGFILDVLKYYTTYKSYYALVKSIADDPKVDKRKAARALARFMSLHPHNIAQKTEIMVEHFHLSTQHKIDGRAKAMVVTEGRAHAVRYKLAFDKYIAAQGYTNIKTLVAFSGEVEDSDAPGVKYTEASMNRDGQGRAIREKELPKRFGSDEYQVLLVADKYQTGFDEPFLHTMYVDKRLSGVQAVQTLSRLNRTAAGKTDTFVLDFVNERAEIHQAFQPYYEQTTIGERATVQQLYELQAKLDAAQVYYVKEVDEFCRVFYAPKRNQTSADHARMNACIDPAVNRYQQLAADKQEEFRKALVAFRNLYSLLSQIIPFQDSELEKRYAYIHLLLAKLPQREFGPGYNFDADVALKSYRLTKLSDGSINLEANKPQAVDGPTSVGTKIVRGEAVELSKLIDVLNTRFGTEFKPSDQLFFDSISEDAVADPELRQAAHANPIENFGYVFNPALKGIFSDRLDQNQAITTRFMNDAELREAISEHILNVVYKRIRDNSEG